MRRGDRLVWAKSQLALKLLSKERWTDQRRRDLVATVLMLTNPDVISVGHARMDERSVRPDEVLLTSLYAHSSLELRVALVETGVSLHLRARTFKRLFWATWNARGLTALQRDQLAGMLSARLFWHHEEAQEYRDLILALLWSRKRDLCLRALAMAGWLTDIPLRDLDRLKSKVTSRWFGFRMHALNGLCELVKLHREVSPDRLASATSPEIRSAAARIMRTDPDRGARTCAYYLLKAIREYDRARAARRPYPKTRPASRSKAVGA